MHVGNPRRIGVHVLRPLLGPDALVEPPLHVENVELALLMRLDRIFNVLRATHLFGGLLLGALLPRSLPLGSLVVLLHLLEVLNPPVDLSPACGPELLDGLGLLDFHVLALQPGNSFLPQVVLVLEHMQAGIQDPPSGGSVLLAVLASAENVGHDGR